ncbi:MAG: hypothetical protein ABI591_04860 [Kofleriaceae bacterium]
MATSLSYALVLLVGCGAKSAPPPPPRAATVVVQPPSDEAKHDEIVASHRKIESEQQDALALACTGDAPHDKRCKPSCYVPASADPRAGKTLSGAVEIQHLACKLGDSFIVVDALDPDLTARRAKGRFPKPHKTGWQAAIEHAPLLPKLAHGDVLVVTGTKLRERTDPVTHETRTCVAVSYFTHVRKPLDKCGGDNDGCEATGNNAAHGIDVVHFRLAEARTLQAEHKTAPCQAAALEAIAVARGLPRWRQYAKLNTRAWHDVAAYRTRFDGILDEDSLFAAAASLGSDAEAVYLACGGASAKTAAEDEQSFHGCW